MWMFVLFKQKTAYEMRISDWSSDVCSSYLAAEAAAAHAALHHALEPRRDLREQLVAGRVAERVVDRLEAVAVDHQQSTARLRLDRRSEERRVGTACVRPCRSRWPTYTYNTPDHLTLVTYHTYKFLQT